MNERIRELAEQAGFIPDAFLAKFAELIVQECAKRSGELGQPEIGQGLLKHFEVEQ